MKKLTVDQLPEVRARVSFVQYLEILWITWEKKAPESAKKNFRQVSKIFENLRKFGKTRKMSQSAQDDLPAFLIFFMKSSEVIGNIRNSSDVFVNLRKFRKFVAKC